MQISGFHAHVYFSPETRAEAEALLAKVTMDIAPRLHYLGKLIDRPIGPHPVPMFEIDFETGQFFAVVAYLMANHGSLSALIHPETDNDFLDHTKHALWLGQQLPLKLEIFQQK